MGAHGDRTPRPTSEDVSAFLAGVADERRRADAREVLEAMVERSWSTNHVGEGPDWAWARGRRRILPSTE